MIEQEIIEYWEECPEYLIPEYAESENIVAHVWIGQLEDTACRMWSTGGMGKENKTMITDLGELHVCLICQRKMGWKSTANPGAELMPFGKYRGTPLEEVKKDDQYIEWLDSQPWAWVKYEEMMEYLTAENEQ